MRGERGRERLKGREEILCAQCYSFTKCENFESVDTPTTSQLISLNSLILSEKAMISVGQTKVKSWKKYKGRLATKLQKITKVNVTKVNVTTYDDS